MHVYRSYNGSLMVNNKRSDLDSRPSVMLAYFELPTYDLVRQSVVGVRP